MKTTNYRASLITVSSDSEATVGMEPRNVDSIAGIQFALLQDAPHRMTSDDLLFEVHARRNAVPVMERDKSRDAFFRRPQACLRCSPLVKSHGWGIYHDENQKIALVAVESPDYRRLLTDPAIVKVPGMRRKRA